MQFSTIVDVSFLGVLSNFYDFCYKALSTWLAKVCKVRLAKEFLKLAKVFGDVNWIWPTIKETRLQLRSFAKLSRGTECAGRHPAHTKAHRMEDTRHPKPQLQISYPFFKIRIINTASYNFMFRCKECNEE
eukprot:scpid97464/ scgid27144/ 